MLKERRQGITSLRPSWVTPFPLGTERVQWLIKSSIALAKDPSSVPSTQVAHNVCNSNLRVLGALFWLPSPKPARPGGVLAAVGSWSGSSKEVIVLVAGDDGAGVAVRAGLCFQG